MRWDAIVVGSGFGGAMAAHALVHAGRRVLMLERGGWVARGPHNWGAHGAGLVTPHYSMESAYEVSAGSRRYREGAWHCVGGQSVFYGAASFRFRERDFAHDDGIVGDSGACWPIGYGDLEPFYARAERLLGVAGEAGADATDPWRSGPYLHRPPPLSAPARRIAEAARRLGLRPFPIPLAISYRATDSRRGCVGCGTCDGYACAAEAKNDVATGVLPELQRLGMVLRANTVVVRLARAGARVVAVHYVDRVTGEPGRADVDGCVVLAAGALATPHLLLASGLGAVSPAARAVGRYLTRHRNRLVLGVFPRRPNPGRTFDKQVALHDLYADAPDRDAPRGTLGSIQQLTPNAGLVRAYLPPGVGGLAAWGARYALGLLCIAEDQPRAENGVTLAPGVDRYGLPRLRVRHAHTPRDEAAAAALVRQARRVLREAGAVFTLTQSIETFSHALGTVRMGPHACSAPLDGRGAYRGLDNLFVADGSALPRAGGVNPSLTIAANALRVGTHAAESLPGAPSLHVGAPRARRLLPTLESA
ncbi:MAG: GMC oxidoreductase [Gemmatimonadaceae bacterium]